MSVRWWSTGRRVRRSWTGSTARRAATATFVLNGLVLATWVSRNPRDQERAGAHPGRLELVLLALSSGAVLAPPLAAFVEHHLGAIRTVRWAALLATAVCGLLAGAARMARA